MGRTIQWEELYHGKNYTMFWEEITGSKFFFKSAFCEQYISDLGGIHQTNQQLYLFSDLLLLSTVAEDVRSAFGKLLQTTVNGRAGGEYFLLLTFLTDCSVSLLNPLPVQQT